jgi:hypothetical protein
MNTVDVERSEEGEERVSYTVSILCYCFINANATSTG